MIFIWYWKKRAVPAGRNMFFDSSFSFNYCRYSTIRKHASPCREKHVFNNAHSARVGNQIRIIVRSKKGTLFCTMFFIGVHPSTVDSNGMRVMQRLRKVFVAAVRNMFFETHKKNKKLIKTLLFKNMLLPARRAWCLQKCINIDSNCFAHNSLKFHDRPKVKCL